MLLLLPSLYSGRTTIMMLYNKYDNIIMIDFEMYAACIFECVLFNRILNNMHIYSRLIILHLDTECQLHEKIV